MNACSESDRRNAISIKLGGSWVAQLVEIIAAAVLKNAGTRMIPDTVLIIEMVL